MKIRIGKKVVGEVIGDNFIKWVIGSKHFLRIPPAIAFDTSTLRQAYNYGARYVSVVDEESSMVYRAPIGDIYANGFEVERGYGKQVALPMSGWDVKPLVQWATKDEQNA